VWWSCSGRTGHGANAFRTGQSTGQLGVVAYEHQAQLSEDRRSFRHWPIRGEAEGRRARGRGGSTKRLERNVGDPEQFDEATVRQGIEVSARGRIKADVVEQFRAAGN
jgi:hypothetical protein